MVLFIDVFLVSITRISNIPRKSCSSAFTNSSPLKSSAAHIVPRINTPARGREKEKEKEKGEREGEGGKKMEIERERGRKK